MTEIELVILIAAILVNTYIRWKAMRIQNLSIDRIERVLEIWAESWGDPAEVVKPKLLEALKR